MSNGLKHPTQVVLAIACCFALGSDYQCTTETRITLPSLPAPLPVPGDWDGDRDVDLGDYEVFKSRMDGPELGAQLPGLSCPQYLNFDQDCDIDLLDFAAFQRAFGKGAK